MGYARELEVATDTLQKMHKRGIRILPGGDYGFAWMPHGTNARDLEHFVKYIGMTPMEVLLAATKLGGELMMRPHELGQVREGYLADILLINGDPLKDLALLQDPKKITLVMKDVEIFKTSHDVLPPHGEVRMSTPLPVDPGLEKALNEQANETHAAH
jgi:imidazolonepropionase-like amidohydrolase